MPETCENYLGLVNNCVCYACQIREIYQVLPCSVDFKALEELWNPLSKTVLVNVISFGIKDMSVSEITVKLK